MRDAGELVAAAAAATRWPGSRDRGTGGRGGDGGRRKAAEGAGRPRADIADALAIAAATAGETAADPVGAPRAAVADALKRSGARAIVAQARLGAAAVRRLVSVNEP